MICLASILGGVLAAAASAPFIPNLQDQSQLLGYPKILLLPFICGLAIANFLARWYSFRFPPRYSDPLSVELANLEQKDCLGAKPETPKPLPKS